MTQQSQNLRQGDVRKIFSFLYRCLWKPNLDIRRSFIFANIIVLLTLSLSAASPLLLKHLVDLLLGAHDAFHGQTVMFVAFF